MSAKAKINSRFRREIEGLLALNGATFVSRAKPTITRNKIRDHHRRKAAEAAAIGGTDARQRLEQLADPDADIVDEPPLNDTRRLLTRRVLEMIRHDFDERTWQAFWRMAVEGHSSTDIATDLGMNNDAVRQAKRRVLRRLREELSQLMGN